jgi:hypothetical protein
LGSRWAIYRLIATGDVPAVKLAGKLRLDRADLDALIEALKQRPSERRGAHTRGAAAGPRPTLAPLSRRGSPATQ